MISVSSPNPSAFFKVCSTVGFDPVLLTRFDLDEDAEGSFPWGRWGVVTFGGVLPFTDPGGDGASGWSLNTPPGFAAVLGGVNVGA